MAEFVAEEIGVTEISRPRQLFTLISHRFSSWDPMFVGVTASVLVLLGSLQHNSPFTSKIPGSWFFGVPVAPHPGNGLVELFARWLVYAGLVLCIGTWIKLLRSVLDGKSISLRRLWALFAAWSVPLIVAGPLFSRDIYSYAAQGEMASIGINPYQYGPDALGSNPYLPTVDPLWGHAPSPYGPLFTWFDEVIVHFSGHSPVWSVFGLRLFAVVGVILIAVYAPKIASKLGYSPQVAFVLTALNPLVIYHLLSPGHNDALMLGILLTGIYYFLEGKVVRAVVLAAAAASIKIPAIAAVGFMGYNWTGVGEFRSRLRSLLTATGLGIVVIVAATVGSGLGWGWIAALGGAGKVVSSVDPVSSIAVLMHRLTEIVGLPLSKDLYLSVTRFLGLLVASVVGLFLLLRSDRSKMVRYLGLTLLAFVIAGPVIWPWYLAWGVVVLGCIPGKVSANVISMMSVFGMVLGLPGGDSFVSWAIYLSAVLTIAVLVAARKSWISQAQLERLKSLAWSLRSAFGVTVGSSG